MDWTKANKILKRPQSHVVQSIDWLFVLARVLQYGCILKVWLLVSQSCHHVSHAPSLHNGFLPLEERPCKIAQGRKLGGRTSCCSSLLSDALVQETTIQCKFRDKFILILEQNGKFRAAVEPRKRGEPWSEYLLDPRHYVSRLMLGSRIFGLQPMHRKTACDPQVPLSGNPVFRSLLGQRNVVETE
jgi:hypothetical protein